MTTSELVLVHWKDFAESMDRSEPNGAVPAGTTFRITRIVYDELTRKLLLFLSTNADGVARQLVFRCRQNISSYFTCTACRAAEPCGRNCVKYTTAVIAGLENTENVVYVNKRVRGGGVRSSTGKDYANDKFLSNPSRVHHQLGLYEGAYVRTWCVLPYKNFIIDNFDYQKLIVLTATQVVGGAIEPAVLSVDIEVRSETGAFPQKENPLDQIISIGAVFKPVRGELLQFAFALKPDGGGTLKDATRDESSDGPPPPTFVVLFDTERAMIAAFFDTLHLLNPDIVTDYNGDGFDWPYLLFRGEIEKPFKRYDLPEAAAHVAQITDKTAFKECVYQLAYYNHLDLYKYFKNSGFRLENYRLNTIAGMLLGRGKDDMPAPMMNRLYREGRLGRILQYNVTDCQLVMELLNKCKVVDEVYSQCETCFVCMDEVFKGVASKLSSMLFYYCLNNTDEVDGAIVKRPYYFDHAELRGVKYSKDGGSSEGGFGSLPRTRVNKIWYRDREDVIELCDMGVKLKLEGGFVMTPKPGVSGYAMTVDFNSLYPSIMIAEGVCFTNLFTGDDNKLYRVRNSKAVVPKLLTALLAKRAHLKALMKDQERDSFLYNLYNVQQSATKIVANSMYGYFGLFFTPLANLVTGTGRNLLKGAVAYLDGLTEDEGLKRKHGLDKLTVATMYGDTDSCFVNVEYSPCDPNTQETFLRQLMTVDILPALNATWSGYNLDFENLLRRLIIFKKKNYAYLTPAGAVAHKGGWKRDTPKVLRVAGRAMIERVLHGATVPEALAEFQKAVIALHENFEERVGDMEDYAFSMNYNEVKTTTIAYKCRAALLKSQVTHVPQNNDRVQYVYLDKDARLQVERAMPVQLFDHDKHAMDWGPYCTRIVNYLNDWAEASPVHKAHLERSLYMIDQKLTARQKNNRGKIYISERGKYFKISKPSVPKRKLPPTQSNTLLKYFKAA